MYARWLHTEEHQPQTDNEWDMDMRILARISPMYLLRQEERAI